MNLNDKINDDLKNAMKEKDTFKLGVIRMLKGAIQLVKINLKRELTDDEIVDVVSKQIKMRKDSIVEFEKANRSDLVLQNKNEIAILNNYMPVQLSNDEVLKILDDAFEKVNPTSNKQMGLIMKEVTPLLKGKTDMGEVSKIIKNRLENI